MNYFPFHIGDYASATRHLSWDEDIAYRRLLDIYYTTEKPLPTELRSVYRLVVASTDSQREAVKTVLEEFFSLSEDGWHNERADREIEQMQRKQAEIDEKNAHEKERMRRHRERRSEMFEALRKAGVTPAWDIPMAELQRLHDKTCNAPETDLQREQAVSCNGGETAIPTPTPTPTPTPKSNSVVVDLPSTTDPTPHTEILALWSEVMPEAVQPAQWTDARKTLLRTRWRESEKRQSIDYWRRLFTYIRASDFLMGREAGHGRRPFAISLDWLLKQENFLKVIEGKFHQQKEQA